MLTALAAFRADAGYVTVAAPESALPVLEARLLEAVKRPLPEDSSGTLAAPRGGPVLEAAERADAVALGPGLGRSDGTRELVRILLERLEVPVVLDADALWELEPFERAAPTVHDPALGRARPAARRRRARDRRAPARGGPPGRLALRRGRPAQGRGHARRAPREGVLVAAYGAPSLATAGTGDVLTGVIAAFLAKGLEPRLAAAAAAVAHGVASRLVEPGVGLVASDLLPGIQRALAGEGWDLAPLA